MGPLTPGCSAQGLLQPRLLWTSLFLQVPVCSAQQMRALGAALKALDKGGQNQTHDISVPGAPMFGQWCKAAWNKMSWGQQTGQPLGLGAELPAPLQCRGSAPGPWGPAAGPHLFAP